MQFQHRRSTSPPAPSAASMQQSQPQEPVYVFLTHLPPNLRAKFGRARCRELLADQAAVQRAWDGIQHSSSSAATTQLPRLPPVQVRHQPHMQQAKQQPNNWYTVLSQQFNSNYSPGVSEARQFGHTGEMHNASQLRRSADYNDDSSERRHHRDDFTVYNEIIHVDRKFNNQWNSEGLQEPRAEASTTRRAPQRFPPPQLASAPSASILTTSGGAGSKSTSPTKRVTISDAAETRTIGGNQSVHRANTVQRVA